MERSPSNKCETQKRVSADGSEEWMLNLLDFFYSFLKNALSFVLRGVLGWGAAIKHPKHRRSKKISCCLYSWAGTFADEEANSRSAAIEQP
jgi:hypothetical protein